MARQARSTTVGRRQASRAADVFTKQPANSVLPAITGTKTQGQTLTCSSGTWSKSPSYAYQWRRNGSAIAGATVSTRLLAAGDVGALMSCTVTATASGVSQSATSAQTTAIVAA